jgi:FixJ family two-component response regulator
VKSATVISIVDDDATVRDGIADLIISLGYAVHTFESAEEFLDSTCLKNTACLITDLHLPGLNGIDLLDRLRIAGHRIPMIVITGFPTAQTRTRALAAGAIAVFAKPFEAAILINSLESALRA